MELESEDGLQKFSILKDSKIELGRASLGFPSNDRTISRCHISLQLHEPINNTQDENYTDPDGEVEVSFHVIGKNPIWVFSSDGGEKRVFRNLEKGALRAGDRFSISLKKPVFFTLKKRDFEEKEEEEDDEKRVLKAVERRKKRTLERKEEEEMRVLKDECSLGDNSGVEEGSGDIGLGSLDLLQIDPIKEFGFLVMGEEFNQYPKQKIKHFKDWDWFLEEPREDSEDHQADEKEMQKGWKGEKRKKRGEVVNDDDWMGESKDEEVLVAKLRKGKQPKYSTRSKDMKKPYKDTSSKKSVHQKTTSANEDENEEDEDEDTLDGFIVNDDDLEEEKDDDNDNDIDDEDQEEEEEYDDDVDTGEEDTED